MGQFSRLLTLTLIVAAFAAPAQAGYMVIDFDDLATESGGVDVPLGYKGITWGTGAEQLMTYSWEDLWFGAVQNAGFVTLKNINTQSSPHATTASWALPYETGFGGAKFAAANSTGNITFYYELRDLGGNLLATSPSTLVQPAAGFTWVPSGYNGADVSSVKVYATAGAWAMDDVTFTPEPCTLALVGLGLAGVGLRRRRSRAGKGRRRQTAAA